MKYWTSLGVPHFQLLAEHSSAEGRAALFKPPKLLIDSATLLYYFIIYFALWLFDIRSRLFHPS